MRKNNIGIIVCKDKEKASKKALELLKDSVNFDTLLLLSGGSSPKLLYQMIVKDRTLKPGAVALIDERYGLSMHDNSNEKMIVDSGLTDYINNEGIPSYGILEEGNLEEAAVRYEQTIKKLLKKFPKAVINKNYLRYFLQRFLHKLSC